MQTANKILDRLHVENRTWTRITSKYRLEKHMFEPVPVREAVINMLVHNQYINGYTPVVELFSDRLELTSIGGLPDGLSVEDFFHGVSMPRNREIMRVFRDVEMVEQLGSGMNRILKDYDRSIFTIGDGYIRVTFKYVLGFDDQSAISPRTNSKLVKQTNEPTRSHVSKEALKAQILSYLRNNQSASYQEISEALGIVRSTVGKYIKELVEAGLLKREGNTRSGTWIIL